MSYISSVEASNNSCFPPAINTPGKKLLYAIAIIVALGSVGAFITGLSLPPAYEILSLGLLIGGGVAFFLSGALLERLKNPSDAENVYRTSDRESVFSDFEVPYVETREGRRNIDDLQTSDVYDTPPAQVNTSPFASDRMSYTYAPRSDRISIEVVQSDVKGNPIPHLYELTNLIDQFVRECARAKIHVNYRTESASRGIVNGRAVDAGGPSKNYLDDLMESITDINMFKTLDYSSLAYPVAERQDIDHLHTAKLVGKVIMFCHGNYGNNTADLVIGSHFDPSVFAGVFTFKAAEMDVPFEDLPNREKIRFYQSLLNAREDVSRDRILALLHKSRWTPAEANEAKAFLAVIGYDVEESQKRNREFLFQYLAEEFDSTFIAIQAMAQGMRDVCIMGRAATRAQLNATWERQWRSCEYRTFALNVQGTIDKERVALALQVGRGNAVVIEKVRWLQEWVRTEATPAEIEQMLKYFTGSSGLSGRSRITFNGGNQWPEPSVHTCSNSVDIASIYHHCERGKNNFIAMIKACISGDTSFTFA